MGTYGEDLIDFPGLESITDDFLTLLGRSTPRHHVLIRGPRGVGKTYYLEVFKKHYEYKNEDITHLNCATIPPDLASSELFGYVKGTFTGADADKSGLIETAARSKSKVLILEELNSLASEDQAKLLVFVETFSFYRVGGRKPEKAEVRIVATMNFEPESSQMREDLLDRFRVVVDVPPLHSRRQDILYYMGCKYPDLILECEELFAIFGYHWPGNIRELEKVLWERQFVIPAIRKKIPSYRIFSERCKEISKTLKSLGLSNLRYDKIDKSCFGGLLTYKGVYSVQFQKYVSDFVVKVSLGTERDRRLEILMLKGDSLEVSHRVHCGIIRTYFMLIYGRAVIDDSRPIYEHEPFSEEAMAEIKLCSLIKFQLRPEQDLSGEYPFYKIIREDLKVLLTVSMMACRKKINKNINNIEDVSSGLVADFLLGSNERFREVLEEMLSQGKQKNIAIALGVSTQLVNKWSNLIHNRLPLSGNEKL